MPGTFEMSSERRRNEPVLPAAKIAEVSLALPPRSAIGQIFGKPFNISLLVFVHYIDDGTRAIT